MNANFFFQSIYFEWLWSTQMEFLLGYSQYLVSIRKHFQNSFWERCVFKKRKMFHSLDRMSTDSSRPYATTSKEGLSMLFYHFPFSLASAAQTWSPVEKAPQRKSKTVFQAMLPGLSADLRVGGFMGYVCINFPWFSSGLNPLDPGSQTPSFTGFNISGVWRAKHLSVTNCHCMQLWINLILKEAMAL